MTSQLSNPLPASPTTLKPPYEAPQITSYTSEEILAQVGPALTCSPSPVG